MAKIWVPPHHIIGKLSASYDSRQQKRLAANQQVSSDKRRQSLELGNNHDYYATTDEKRNVCSIFYWLKAFFVLRGLHCLRTLIHYSGCA